MKLKDLENISLNAGIHTFEANGIDPNCKHRGVEIIRRNNPQENNKPTCFAKINPHHYFFEEDRYIESYADMKEAFRIIEEQCCLTPMTLNRVDFRIDDYTNPFQKYAKLNRLTATLLTSHLDIHGAMENHVPITHEFKSFFAKDHKREIQVYDRTQKKGANGLAKGRFEIRNKFDRRYPITPDSIPQHVYNWTCALALCNQHFDKIMQKSNETLLKRWETEGHTEIKTFIRFVHEDIYTRKQLEDLLSQLPTKNVKSLSYDCTRDIDINLITPQILKQYVLKMIKALNSFIGNTERNIDFTQYLGELPDFFFPEIDSSFELPF